MAPGASYLAGVIDLSRDATDAERGTNRTQPSLDEVREGHRMAKVLSRNGSLQGNRSGVQIPRTEETLSPLVRDFEASRRRGQKKGPIETDPVYQQRLKRTFDGLLKESRANGHPFVDYKLDSAAQECGSRKSDTPPTTRLAGTGAKRSEGRTSFSALFAAAQNAGHLDDDVDDAPTHRDDVQDIERSRSPTHQLGAQRSPNLQEATLSEPVYSESGGQSRVSPDRAPSEDSLIPADVRDHTPPTDDFDEPSDLPTFDTTVEKEQEEEPIETDDNGPVAEANGARSPQTTHFTRASQETGTPEKPSELPQPTGADPRVTPGLISRTVKRLVRDQRAGIQRMFEQNGSNMRQRQTPQLQSSDKSHRQDRDVTTTSSVPRPEPMQTATQERRKGRPSGPTTLGAGKLNATLEGEKPAWANRPHCAKGTPFTHPERRKIAELRLFHKLSFNEIASWFPGRTTGVIATTWNKSMESKLEDYLTPAELQEHVPVVRAMMEQRNAPIPASYYQFQGNGADTAPTVPPVPPIVLSPDSPRRRRGRPPKVRPEPVVAPEIRAERSTSENSQRNDNRPRRNVARPQDYYARIHLQEDEPILSPGADQPPPHPQPEDENRHQRSETLARSSQQPAPRRHIRRTPHEPEPDPKPYLTIIERRMLRLGLPDHSWDNQRLASWKGAPLHVDFSSAELDEIGRAIRAVIPTNNDSTDLRSLLDNASEAQLRLITWNIKKDEKLPSRTLDDIEAFLSDLQGGFVNKRPVKQRVGISSNRPAHGHLLRQRELGLESVRTRTSLRDELLDDLRPSKHFEKTSGDVGTVAWSPDGESFAAGSMALVDSDSMQYNLPNNLLVGNMCREDIRELAAHYTTRKRTDKGPNSTREMHVTQDSRLFSTVSHVDFSSDGMLMYSAGYDGVVRYWDNTSSEIGLVDSIAHKAPVDLLAVKPWESGEDHHILATGSQVSEHSVQVFQCTDDGPKTLFQCSSAQALAKPQAHLHPSALRWGVHSRVSHCLLAGFATNRPEDRDGPDTLGGVSIWDVDMITKEAKPIRIRPNTRNVFDAAWSPHSEVFAVACMAGNDRGDRRMRSEVKLFSLDQNQGPIFKEWMTLECPASDMNDVVFSPYDYNLVSVGCTDGSIYIWDVRQPYEILHQFSHGEPLQTMHYDTMREREKLDTGVRFTSWGHTRDRMYTGSSDGIVSQWNPYRSAEDAKQRDLVRLDSGVMSGAFSPDYTKLLVGSVNGRVDILEVGSDRSIRTSKPLRKISATNPAKAPQQSAANDPDSGVSAARALIEAETIEYRLMGALPIRQAVQGPKYNASNLHDTAPGSDQLRAKATDFQTTLRNQLLSLDKCTAKKCAEYSKGTRVTAESAGDSGRSADRIPGALRAAQPDDSAPPGMGRCAMCGRPARPRDGNETTTPRCERCSFTCLACGDSSAAQLSSSRVNCIECTACGGVWRADVLGYEVLVEPRALLPPSIAASAKWQKQSKRWAKGITALKTAAEGNEELNEGEVEVLREQADYLDDMYSRFVAEVDKDF